MPEVSQFERMVTITEDEIDSDLQVGSEGKITLSYKVKSISSRDDEMLGDEDKIYFSLQLGDVIEINLDKPSLDKAAERAAQGAKPLRVKNSINPAP